MQIRPFRRLPWSSTETYEISSIIQSNYLTYYLAKTCVRGHLIHKLYFWAQSWSYRHHLVYFNRWSSQPAPLLPLHFVTLYLQHSLGLPLPRIVPVGRPSIIAPNRPPRLITWAHHFTSTLTPRHSKDSTLHRSVQPTITTWQMEVNSDIRVHFHLYEMHWWCSHFAVHIDQS